MTGRQARTDGSELRQTTFQVGAWHVDPRGLRLRRAGDERRIDPRVMDLLVELAAAGGAVVSRDELMQLVWRDAFVSENTIVQAVSRLRRALDDTAQNPEYVETISKTGYRLVAGVTVGSREHSFGLAGRTTVPARRTVPLALLTVLAVLALMIWSAPARQPLLLAARPLLTNPGRQPAPTLSPDGSQVAFVWQAPGRDGWDLYVQRPEDDEPTRLTPDSGAWQFPAWTADGRLAVLSTDDGCGIFLAALDAETLTHAVGCPPGSIHLRWSPDGRTFIVSAPARDGRELVMIDAGTGVRRSLLPAGLGPTGPVNDVSPAFSPDGRSVAFVRALSTSLYVVMASNVDGSGLRPLTDDAWGQVRGLDWWADGQSVVYASSRSGAFRLWRVGIDGSAPERVPIEDEWLVSPRLSRAGDRLVYRTFNDEIDLWTHDVGADGVAAPVAKMVPSTRSEHEPALSPDGTRLAFVSDRTGSMELWSSDVDGSQLTRHTAFEGPRPTMATWSPDASELVFSADPLGQHDLFRVVPDSREPVPLTSTAFAETNPTFSRDGERLYFASDRSGQWQLWVMPAAGGEARQLTQAGGFYGQEDLSGAFLYFVRLEEPGLWRMPSTGGPPEPVLLDYDFDDWASWAVTARGIFFTRHALVDGYRRPSIELFDPADRTHTVVGRPDKQIPYLSRSLTASPDGRRLIVSLIERSDDEVLLVDLK